MGIPNGSVRYNTAIAGLDSHWSSSSIQTVDPIQSKSTGRLDPIQPNPIQFAANPTRSPHQSSIPNLYLVSLSACCAFNSLISSALNIAMLCAYSRAIMSSSRAPSPVPSTSQSIPSRLLPTRVDDAPNFTPATSEAILDDELDTPQCEFDIDWENIWHKLIGEIGICAATPLGQ